MYSKLNLKSFLYELGVDPKSALMVHLSYKAIGDVDGRGDAVLDALMEYMQPGLLVLPGHTWSNVGSQNPVMDVLYTPTCVGVLTELFRKRPGVLRSLHPTHSLAAFGAEAENLLTGEENIQTPCGAGGAYYRLWERDAQILLIGVNFNCNTFVHGIEEWDGAFGTISPDKTDMYVINYEGKRLYTPQYRHCAPLGSETFCKLEAPAVQRNILKMGRFGDATARFIHAKALRAMTAELLSGDPRYLYRY